jgi:hypothetical protein
VIGSRRSGWSGVSLVVVLALLAVIVVLQARYIWVIQREGDLVHRGAHRDGVPVPELEGSNLAGNLVLVSYTAVRKPTIIYVFRPVCPWCERKGLPAGVCGATAG